MSNEEPTSKRNIGTIYFSCLAKFLLTEEVQEEFQTLWEWCQHLKRITDERTELLSNLHWSAKESESVVTLELSWDGCGDQEVIADNESWFEQMVNMTNDHTPYSAKGNWNG